MSVGTSINLATHVLPMTGTFLFLLDKQTVLSRMTFAGVTQDVSMAAGVPLAAAPPAGAAAPATPVEPGAVVVDLVRLAFARSGDKGHLFNVAVIARQQEYLPYLRAALTPEAVGEWYLHLGPVGQSPRVDRYDVPGFQALNFVLHDALAGGINASIRLDPAAKGMAQMLLRFPIPVPATLAAALSDAASAKKGN